MKKILRSPTLILLIGLAAVQAPPVEAATSSQPNLVLVTVDTWRWDYLGATGERRVETPNLDGLAQRGMLFDQTRVAAPVTLTSHASIFTGLHPTAHGVHHNGIFALGGAHETLAEVLQAKGYQTLAVTGAFVVSSRYGLNQGFDSYLDVISESLYGEMELSAAYPELTADEVTDRALRTLSSVDPSRPWFLWVHYFDVHGEYKAPEPFASRYPDDAYAAEVAFVDSELGRLFEGVQEQSDRNPTAWIVTSDHGESLGEHGELSHGHFLYDSTLRVSTVMSLPDAPQGVRISDPVRSIDLMPTLLDAFDIVPPEGIQGRSLRPLWEKGSHRVDPAYGETFLTYYDYGWGYLRSLVFEGWKLVQGPSVELYDLEQDPGEMKNLAGREVERLGRMKNTLEKMIRATSRSTDGRVRSTAAEQSTLASLGYLSGGTNLRPEETAEELQLLPDPRKMIYLARWIRDAWAVHDRGNDDKALDLLDKILKKNPQNTHALRFASSLSRRQGDWPRSLAYLEQLASHWPSEAWRYPHLHAEYERQQGRLDRAEKILETMMDECEQDPEPDTEKCLSALRDLVHVRLAQDDERGARRALKDHPLSDRHDLSVADALRISDLLVKAGLTEEAERSLKSMSERFPDVPDLPFAIGNLYRDAGRATQAMAAFQRALEVDPSFVPAMNNLAVIYGSRGQLAHSNAQLATALKWEPRNSRALGNLGLNRYLQGEVDEARELLERAARLDPGAVRVRLNLAQLYAQNRDTKRARSLAQEVIDLDPENPQARELIRSLG